MARVVFPPHLRRFFSRLEEVDIVAELVAALDRHHPGLAGYIVDDRGALRRHVNIFVGQELVRDHERLGDPLDPDAAVSTAGRGRAATCRSSIRCALPTCERRSGSLGPMLALLAVTLVAQAPPARAKGPPEAALRGEAATVVVTRVPRTRAEPPPGGHGAVRQAIRPAHFPDTGLPYSPGILAGDTLYLSGQIGRDPVTAKLVLGGIEPETRQTLANLREVLRSAGMDLQDVVSVTVFIASFDDFAAFNRVYREHFPDPPPARATVQVAGLNLGARVEIQMIAVRGQASRSPKK